MTACEYTTHAKAIDMLFSRVRSSLSLSHLCDQLTLSLLTPLVAAVSGHDVDFQLYVLDEVDSCVDQRLQAIEHDRGGEGCAMWCLAGAHLGS